MIWMILTPILAAGFAPWLTRYTGRYAAWLAALIPGSIAALMVARLPILPGEARSESYAWVPSLGVDLALRLDGLSAVFVILIGSIGMLVLLYAGSYMTAGLGRLLGLLLVFIGAMLGVVLSDNLIVLFVFWELTSIASYFLIGFKHGKEEARASARQAMLVTGAGGLALLSGIVLLAIAGAQSGVPAGGAWMLSALIGSDVSTHGLFVPAMFLIVLGAMSKSAQVPLHFWLPNAMTAPTPVSAFLHSATMVKAGVYLLARMNPLFGHSAVWHGLLIGAGAMTMLTGALMAARQTDMKRILAYTTVSVLGTLTMLIGIGTDLAIKAAVVYLVAHACYKAALFMIAGTLEQVTGTRDVRRLGGLARAMPVTLASGILAALSMAGAPPLFGFIGKELLLKAKLGLDSLGAQLIVIAVVANVFLIAMALAVVVWPFFRTAKPSSRTAHEPAWPMLVGPLVLGVAGFFVGLIPDVFDRTLGSAIASAIGGRTIIMQLKLWHGLSPSALTALGISVLTLLCGVTVFYFLRRWLIVIRRMLGSIRVPGPGAMYEALYEGTLAVAGLVTRATQAGGLAHDIRLILLLVMLLCAYPLIQSGWPGIGSPDPGLLVEAALAVLLVSGAVFALFSRSRMSALAALGITGILIASLFALYSAPDLAITQILVEALTVVLLVLVFRNMPRSGVSGERAWRWWDAGIATAFGLCMAFMLHLSATLQAPAAVSRRMAELSLPEAYGRNVVNVILVDFRALDTLGEVTVVAAAAVGVCALVRFKRPDTVEGGEA